VAWGVGVLDLKRLCDIGGKSASKGRTGEETIIIEHTALGEGDQKKTIKDPKLLQEREAKRNRA